MNQTGVKTLSIDIVNFLLSVIAMYVSWLLFLEYNSVAIGKGLSLAFCDASPLSGCRLAALSPYAQVYPGLPAAALGFGYFLVSAIVCLIIFFKPDDQKRITRSWLILQFVGVSASFYYLFIMFFVLHGACNGCLILHLINFSLTALRLWRLKSSANSSYLKKNYVSLIACILTSLIVLSAYSLVRIRPLTDINSQKEFSVSLEKIEIPTFDSFKMILGRGSQPVKIKMAIDLTCPYCKENLLNLTEALVTLGMSAEVDIILFPLDSDCNPFFLERLHRSCTVSKVAICRAAEGKFSDFVRSSYLNQWDLVEEVNSAVMLLEPDEAKRKKLKTCVSSQKTQTILQQMLNKLQNAPIEKRVFGAPTTWVKGYQLVGRLHSSNWVSLLTGKNMLDSENSLPTK